MNDCVWEVLTKTVETTTVVDYLKRGVRARGTSVRLLPNEGICPELQVSVTVWVITVIDISI